MKRKLHSVGDAYRMVQKPEEFIQAAMEGLRVQTAAHCDSWGLDRIREWNVDIQSGMLDFALADGRTARAPIQIVGTYNTEDDTFMWGWEHPSVPAALGKHAELARDWGREHSLAACTTNPLACTLDEAWEFAALCNRLADANGVYRGVFGSTLVFMTFGSITFSGASAGPRG